MTFRVPESCRVTDSRAPMSTRAHAGRFGAFIIDAPTGRVLFCIASDGGDWTLAGLPGVPWEHVSVSILAAPSRTPSWDEMNFIKAKFWDDEDCVVQFHPPRSDYVNCHPGVLHLWRPVGVVLPRPPSIAVGPKT